jgi:hypothetical protein
MVPAVGTCCLLTYGKEEGFGGSNRTVWVPSVLRVVSSCDVVWKIDQEDLREGKALWQHLSPSPPCSCISIL